MFRRGLFYSYLSIYLRYFLGLSVTETTLFATLPMIFNVGFQTYVWGPLSDRLQLRKTLIVRGEILAGGGTLLVWYGHKLADERHMAGYVIIVGLTAVEIFWSMSNVGWSALISDVYRPETRGAVQGRLTSVGGVGRIAGIWIGGLLYDGMGARYDGWGFYEGALFFIASLVMLLSVIPMRWVPEGGAGNKTAPSGKDENSSAPLVFTIFLIAMTLINFGRQSIAVILPQYLVLDSGLAVSSRTVGHIVNMQSLSIILFGLCVGRLERRMGIARVLLWGTASAVVSLLMMGACQSLVMMYAANFVRGISEAVVWSAAYAMASFLISPEHRGRGFSLFNATFFLSWGLAGTFIAGPIVDLLMIKGWEEGAAYRMSFYAAAGITAAGMALLTVQMRRMRSETSFRV